MVRRREPFKIKMEGRLEMHLKALVNTRTMVKHMKEALTPMVMEAETMVVTGNPEIMTEHLMALLVMEATLKKTEMREEDRQDQRDVTAGPDPSKRATEEAEMIEMTDNR
jgi:hypothetical protein